jgi:UDP-2,4-diacetamido-2,4,6-trideoxy-beta-L-altropyranose hydrolase
MRCLALAHALRTAGVECEFICRPLPDSLAALLTAAGHGLSLIPGPFSVADDVAATLAALDGRKVDWLVVDHYGLDAGWERAVRVCAQGILAIDDLADREHDCDVLLDQNPYAGMESRYDGKLPRSCRTLLGARFALLREEFVVARKNAVPRSGAVHRLLIFFGGMDNADCTSAAVEAAARVLPAGTAVDVVIGAEFRRREHIAEFCASHGYALHVQTSRMAALMASADLALGAGGSASWERCCLGLPALVVVVAENQRALVRDAAHAGLLFAPEFEDFSAASFAKHLRTVLADASGMSAMSERGMATVDGQGVRRVVRALGITEVAMRPATMNDARDLFDWRNDPAIRQVSRNSASIDWNTHMAWLSGVLADPDRPLLIGELAGAALGVVRFDIERDKAEVSIYKVPRQSGPGTGGDLLAAAELWLRQRHPAVRQVVAEVLGDNRASHGLFAAAGYHAEAGRYTKRMFP